MTVLEHWFEEVWNKQNAAAIDELWALEKKVHGLPGVDGRQVETRAAFKAFHQQFCSAFPDLHVRIEDTITEGNKIAARVYVTGTHMGPGLSKEPTGKSVGFAGICIAHVHDGRVLESWNSFDFMSMYQQLE